MKNHETSVCPCILKKALSDIEKFQTGAVNAWLESFCQLGTAIAVVLQCLYAK